MIRGIKFRRNEEGIDGSITIVHVDVDIALAHPRIGILGVKFEHLVKVGNRLDVLVNILVERAASVVVVLLVRLDGDGATQRVDGRQGVALLQESATAQVVHPQQQRGLVLGIKHAGGTVEGGYRLIHIFERQVARTHIGQRISVVGIGGKHLLKQRLRASIIARVVGVSALLIDVLGSHAGGGHREKNQCYKCS